MNLRIAIAQCDNDNLPAKIEMMCRANNNDSTMILFPELVKPPLMPGRMVTGFGFETVKRRKKYNSYYLTQNAGVLYEYRKRHMFPGYDDGRTPGNKTEPFLKNIYFAVCYDIRFADVFNEMNNPGLIIIPADFPLCRINEWRKMLIARAMQMQCCVIGINTPSGGQSMVVMPDGEIVKELPSGETELLMCDFSAYTDWEEYLHDRNYTGNICRK